MTKSEYITKHGLTLRKVTKEDRQCARTDYQREAEYIISNGKCEYYSKNGSLRDLMYFVKAQREEMIMINSIQAAKYKKEKFWFTPDGKIAKIYDGYKWI